MLEWVYFWGDTALIKYATFGISEIPWIAFAQKLGWNEPFFRNECVKIFNYFLSLLHVEVLRLELPTHCQSQTTLIPSQPLPPCLFTRSQYHSSLSIVRATIFPKPLSISKVLFTGSNYAGIVSKLEKRCPTCLHRVNSIIQKLSFAWTSYRVPWHLLVHIVSEVGLFLSPA